MQLMRSDTAKIDFYINISEDLFAPSTGDKVFLTFALDKKGENLVTFDTSVNPFVYIEGDLDNSTITFDEQTSKFTLNLTQEDTNALIDRMCYAQIKILFNDDNSAISADNIETVTITNTLSGVVV